MKATRVQAEFVGSFTSLRQLPRLRLPEIAFAGRSNVGKSSLINSLLGRKSLARISSTPGKTRQLNYLLINGRFYFVDLPGYGFARVSKAERQQWAALIEAYLSNNRYLRSVVCLIDARHGPMASDLELMDWLASAGASIVVVATKVDKLKQGELQRAKHLILAEIEGRPVAGPVFYSATKRLGRRELWQYLTSVLE